MTRGRGVVAADEAPLRLDCEWTPPRATQPGNGRDTGVADTMRFPGSGQTALKSLRHYQHHDPGAPEPPERHETPDPVRSDAVEPRFHVVPAPGVLAGVKELVRMTSCWVARVIAT